MKIQRGIQYAYLFVMTMAGLNLRIGAVKLLPNMLGEDSLYYQQIAENIYNGYGHTLYGSPVAFKSICYPKILGFFYKATNSADIANGKMLNVAISMLTLLITYFIYKKLFQKRSSVYMAYGLTALLPQYVIYSAIIGAEVFLTFLLAIILFIQLNILDYRESQFILGLLAALCALTKPEMFYYLLVLVVIILAADKDWATAFRHFVIMGLAFVVVLVPWSIRNYKCYEQIIVTSYSSGYILYINNNASNETGEGVDLQEIESTWETKMKINELLMREKLETSPELSRILKKSAKDFISQNKIKFLQLGFLRIANTYAKGASDMEVITDNQLPAASYAFGNIMFTIICGGGLIYVMANFKNIVYCLIKKEHYIDNVAVIVCINILYFFMIVFIYEGGSKHAFPSLLFLIIACVRMFEMIMDHSIDEETFPDEI